MAGTAAVRWVPTGPATARRPFRSRPPIRRPIPAAITPARWASRASDPHRRQSGHDRSDHRRHPGRHPRPGVGHQAGRRTTTGQTPSRCMRTTTRATSWPSVEGDELARQFRRADRRHRRKRLRQHADPARGRHRHPSITTSAFGPPTMSMRSRHNYLDVLPSANFTYDIQKDLFLRLSAAETMSRPDYSALGGDGVVDRPEPDRQRRQPEPEAD